MAEVVHEFSVPVRGSDHCEYKARAFAEQREHFTASQCQRDVVVRDEIAEALRDAGEAKHRLAGGVQRRCARGHFAVDLGSVSTTATLNLPSRMSFSFAVTFACRSAGTLLANVPSGASSEPLNFISEYWP